GLHTSVEFHYRANPADISKYSRSDAVILEVPQISGRFLVGWGFTHQFPNTPNSQYYFYIDQPGSYVTRLSDFEQLNLNGVPEIWLSLAGPMDRGGMISIDTLRVIPEPAPLLLFGVGVLFLVLVGYRKFQEAIGMASE
ncbi:MAG TPA: PEP-CTERM sorting domain-containing protein, partial [Verrucomicrobiae bacterium]